MNLFKNSKKSIKEEKRALLSNKRISFPVHEAYKTLRTNVIFSLPGNKSKCIGVTSSSTYEGKSTTAINLAISLGEIDKKVLLIDCDLRCPTIANKLSLLSEHGLSDYLVGESSLDDVIQTEGSMKIDIIPAGKMPLDPTILLESDEMSELLDLMKEKYEYIIIDFPPIMPVTDAVILSRKIDGYLLVVKHNSSRYREILKMVNQFKFVDARVLGIVYTNKKMEKALYDYKYYEKYYGHRK